MSELTVDTPSSVSLAVPQPTQRPFVNLQPPLTVSPIEIGVEVVNPTDANTVALHIPMDMLYLRIGTDFDGQIQWTLTGPNGGSTTAIWDNPSVVFNGNLSVNPVVTNSRKTVTIDWANTDPGVSFTYTMNALIEINNVLIPIRHDPTVHNDPPTF
jgi:hypothetical protein